MSMEQVIKFDLFRTSVFETEMVDTWLSSWRHCTLEKCSTLYEASAFKGDHYRVQEGGRAYSAP